MWWGEVSFLLSFVYFILCFSFGSWVVRDMAKGGYSNTC